MHTAAPAIDEYVPAAHAIGDAAVAPTGQRQPGDATHAPLHAALVAPVVLLYTPDGHGVHCGAPAYEYLPAAHGAVQLLDVRPKLEPYRPAAQLVHAVTLPLLPARGEGGERGRVNESGQIREISIETRKG